MNTNDSTTNAALRQRVARVWSDVLGRGPMGEAALLTEGEDFFRPWPLTRRCHRRLNRGPTVAAPAERGTQQRRCA